MHYFFDLAQRIVSVTQRNAAQREESWVPHYLLPGIHTYIHTYCNVWHGSTRENTIQVYTKRLITDVDNSCWLQVLMYYVRITREIRFDIIYYCRII